MMTSWTHKEHIANRQLSAGMPGVGFAAGLSSTPSNNLGAGLGQTKVPFIDSRLRY
jgi:hypothetical protein